MNLKALKIFFSFFLICSLTSCEKEYLIKATRILRNETSYHVNVIVYQEADSLFTISINPNEADSLSASCVETRGRVMNCELLFGEFADSVAVEFDGIKRLTYCTFSGACTINGKNLFSLNIEGGANECGYEEDAGGVFVFTFTEEDFMAAYNISSD